MSKLLCNIKTTIALLLFAALLIASFSSPAPLAIAAGSGDKTFVSSNLANEAIVIEVQSGALKFTAIPKSKNFSWLHIKLKDEAGKEYAETNSSRDELLGGKVVSLSTLNKGKYFLQLYISPEQSGKYEGYYYERDFPISVTADGISFTPSLVFSTNSSVYSSKRTDSLALDNYLQPSTDIESKDDKIIALAKSVTKGKTNAYDKAKAIHDWVAANVWYDVDAAGRGEYSVTSAVGVIETKRAVCQGYSNLTAALLRASGIPAKLVSGYALGISGIYSWNGALVTGNERNHVWNEAFIDGRWVIIDTTWDSDNEFANGKFSKNTGLRHNKYFDPTLEAFSFDHKLSNYSEETAVPVAVNVTASGKTTLMDCYNIKGSNYFSVDNISALINGKYQQATVYEKGKQKMAASIHSFITSNSGSVELNTYVIDGSIHVNVADLATLLGTKVEWDNTTSTLVVD